MSAKLLNELGMIEIDSDVIAKIAGYETTKCYGVVGMAFKNKTDGLVSLLRRESVSKGVGVSVRDEKLVIDLHIIAEYGINIAEISRNIVSNVQYVVEKLTGFLVAEVNLFVDSVRVD